MPTFNLIELLNDKSLKIKVRTETLAKAVLSKKISLDELILFARKAEASHKATCIESLEYATQQDATIVTDKVLKFVTEMLTDDAPRVKWESARVIGNIAHLFPTKLDKAIRNLLTNTEYDGTVVRWASAFALGEIFKLKTKHNKELLPAFEAIIKREGDNAIKKKYLEAIKKTMK